MILGLLDPDEGGIEVDGIDPRDDSRAVKSVVGYVSEEAILSGSMTPRDDFELVASVRGLDQEVARERVDRYLSSFDAASVLDQPTATLSRGQRQKVEIVAALMHRPRRLGALLHAHP
ncbi:MAG: ATP-binding cassette domain-containing protein [Spirochaetota bacterium]